MSSLDRLQHLMVQLVQRRRALTNDPEARLLAEEHFTGNGRLTPVEQLEIYRQQFWLRHTSSLVEDFPGVGGILGQRAWERLVEEFLAAHPPMSFTLRDLGAPLAGFIAQQAHWLEHRELVHDMARLEWAYVQAFDSPDVTPLRPERLAAIGEDAWSRTALILAPSAHLLRFRYPVVELRRRLVETEGATVEIPAPLDSRVVVFREGLVVRSEALEEAQLALLEGFAQGLSLPAACGRASDAEPRAAALLQEQIGAWLASWVQRGLIADVSL